RGPRQPSSQFEETPSTYNKAVYFAEREPLAFDSDRPLAYPDTTLCYLRLIPKISLTKSLDLTTLKSEVIAAPLLRNSEYGSVQTTLNKHGGIACTFIATGITASTQLFQNGEIWCVSSSLIRAERKGAPEYLKLPF